MKNDRKTAPPVDHGERLSGISPGRLTFAFLLALVAAQIFYYAPQLPDRVVDNFAFDGTPNGSSGKTAFFILYAALVAFIGLVFFGISLLLHRIPPSLINMPNKDYWLAPERKAESLAFLSNRMILAGDATVAFIAITFQEIILINLNVSEEEPRLGYLFWMIMGGYFVYMTVWVVRVLIRFRKPVDFLE